MMNFEQGSAGGADEAKEGKSSLSFDWLIEPLNDCSQRVGRYIRELKNDLEIPELVEEVTSVLKTEADRSGESSNESLIFERER